jgi:hypothetical protein
MCNTYSRKYIWIDIIYQFNLIRCSAFFRGTINQGSINDLKDGMAADYMNNNESCLRVRREKNQAKLYNRVHGKKILEEKYLNGMKSFIQFIIMPECSL